MNEQDKNQAQKPAISEIIVAVEGGVCVRGDAIDVGYTTTEIGLAVGQLLNKAKQDDSQQGNNLETHTDSGM